MSHFKSIILFPKRGNERLVRSIYFLPLFLFIAATLGAYMAYGNNFIHFSKIIGLGGHYMAGGDSNASGSGVESIGNIGMSNSEYSIGTFSTDPDIVSKLAGNLDQAHCYPNPFRPNAGFGHKLITFTQLTSYTELMIFNVAGELVYSLEAQTPMGKLEWNVVNNSGQTVASGVYIYVIKNDKGNKKIGKLAVVR